MRLKISPAWWNYAIFIGIAAFATLHISGPIETNFSNPALAQNIAFGIICLCLAFFVVSGLQILYGMAKLSLLAWIKAR